MDSRQIDNFVVKVKEIIDFGQNRASLALTDDFRHIKLHDMLFLIGDNTKKYKDLLELIWRKTNAGEKFTKESVDKQLRSLFARIIENGNYSDLTPYFEQFIKDIENYNIEQVVYLPLDNIEMHGIDRVVFGDIVLTKMTDKKMSILYKKVSKTIKASSHAPEDKAQILETNWRHFIEPLKGKICVEYRYIAEPDLAEELAHKRALDLIDLLRFAIPQLYPSLYPAYLYVDSSLRKSEKERKRLKKNEYRWRGRIGVGLQGEAPIGLRRTVIIPSNELGFEMHGKFVGMRSLTINSENLWAMKKIGVFKLAKLLQKTEGDLTSFEKVLLRSIHWFASAQTQFEVEDELLNLTTSLETVLTDTSEPLTDSVTYGIAFILEKSISKREEIMSRYKTIYSERSKTSHHGFRTADEVDLMELRYMALKTIQFLIKKLDTWKEHKNLLEWVKENKIR